MRTYFGNVQALRGAACLLVVLVHLWVLESKFGLQTPLLRELRWFGYLAVDLFFVISGFILAATHLDKIGRPSAAPKYFARRLWRVYPTYWAAFALSVVVLGSLNGSAVFAGWTRQDWAGWLTLTPLGGQNAFIGQAWTLNYEVMFYAAFGMLLLLPPKLGIAAALGWAGVVVAGYRGPERTGVAAMPVSPFVLEFLGGCAVAWLATREKRGGRAALVLAVGYTVGGILLTLSLVPMPFGDAMSSPRTRVAVFGPPAMLIVYAFAALEGRWRAPRWLVRVGDASYSLYLTHTIVYYAAQWVGYSVSHSRLPHTLWVAGTLAVALLTATTFYLLVERPLMTLGKRKKPQPVAELPQRLAA